MCFYGRSLSCTVLLDNDMQGDEERFSTIILQSIHGGQNRCEIRTFNLLWLTAVKRDR